MKNVKLENKYYELNAVQVFREAVDFAQVEHEIEIGGEVYRAPLYAQAHGVLTAMSYLCPRTEYMAVWEEYIKFKEMLDNVNPLQVQD